VLLCLAVAAVVVSGELHDSFTHGTMPSAAVTAHAPASDNHVWASFIDSEDGQMSGAAETFEDVIMPPHLLDDSDDEGEDDADDSDESSFALIEADTEDSEGEGESSEAEVEETTASVVVRSLPQHSTQKLTRF